jgi:ribonuclease HII
VDHDLRVKAARHRLADTSAEVQRLTALAERQHALHEQGCRVVAGVDEVGRGALAGPVTAAAAVMPADAFVPGLDDSKRLAPARRRRISALLEGACVSFCVAHAGPAEIDSLGIVEATRLAMCRALEGLPVPPDHVLVDGLRVRLPYPSTAIVGGDASVGCIAAASVLAKVARDALMTDLDRVHPGYGFASHKGYGSKGHLDALGSLGPSPAHRMSFAPCRQRALF